MNKLSHSIPDGYELTEHGVFPKEWDIKAIGEIASVSSGGTPNRKVKDFWDGDIPWVTTTLINGNDISYANEFITKKGLESSSAKMCKAGSILMAMYGQGKTRGKAGVLTIDASINQACAAIEVNSSDSGEYILHTLNYMYEDIRELSNSGGQENLSSGIIKGIKLPLPSKSEQTAIANALSDVDALLTELEKLIAKKQAIKTATMQQLLTGKTRLPQFAVYSKESAEVATYTEGAVEGASQGQPKHSSGTNVNVGACDDGSQSTAMDSRRKGTKPSELGEIPEDWDCLDFSDIFTCKQGIQVPVEKQSLIESTKTVRFIRIIDLTDQQEPPRYILNPGNKYLVKKSDLFMVRYGVPGLVGFNYEGVIANNLFRLLPKVNCSTSFYAHYLSYRHKDILDSSGSSTMPAISFSTLAKFKIKRPHSENEQTAIATILSDMDNEIQSLEQRLTKTRQIKQGMMQQLLTGRTRLPY